MNIQIGFLSAILLTGCTASTIEVDLEPSSEAKVHFEFDEEIVPEEQVIQEITLPSKAYLDVPFTSQAPEANWDNPYQEACEEASVIMVDYFLRNAELTPAQANREILQLTTWEESHGYKYDVSLDQLAAIVEEYYGYQTRISDDVTKESIMHELSKGNPVIVPAAGRELGNPNFSGQGPWYHMLVITGYNWRHFYTNDPGTKRGFDYTYKHRVLIDAIHDWTGVKEEIRTGPKRMLIIEKKV
ncbi:MAG: C39 family peptidase [bacterium]|nr:C39 family peptidase [bacterium]